MKTMRRAFGPSVVVAAVLAVFAGSAWGAEEAPDPESVVLAELDWDGRRTEITLAQVEREISELPSYRKDDYDGRAGREEYLTLMAESRILLERARDLGIDDEAEITKKVEDYRLDSMLDEVKELEVDQKVEVTEEEIHAYYEANKEEKYALPEQVRITGVTMDNRAVAEDLLAKVLAGESTIEDVVEDARKTGQAVGSSPVTDFYSRAGVSDIDGLADPMFALGVGETTPEVIEVTRRGRTYYMFFRSEEKQDPRIQTLDEVRMSVERTSRREQEKAREEAWNEELRAIAKAVVYQDRVPAAPEEAADGEDAGGTDENALPEDVDAGLVLAEYSWDGTDHTFTYGDMKQAFESMPSYRRSRYKTQERRVDFLEEQIRDRLRLFEAGDLGFGAQEEDLRTYAEYRHQLMVEALVEREVDEQVVVTDEQLQVYYDGHVDEYVEPERVRLTCLTLTEEGDAVELLGEIQGGRDIVEAATTLSEMGKNVGPGMRTNGNTGLFHRSQYDAAAVFREAAFSVPVGEMTPDILVQELDDVTYYVIFRVEEKVDQRTKPLDEVRSNVESAVERINKRELLDSWLADLKGRADLRLHLERLPQDPDPEPEPEVDEGAEG